MSSSPELPQRIPMPMWENLRSTRLSPSGHTVQPWYFDNPDPPEDGAKARLHAIRHSKALKHQQDRNNRTEEDNSYIQQHYFSQETEKEKLPSPQTSCWTDEREERQDTREKPQLHYSFKDQKRKLTWVRSFRNHQSGFASISKHHPLMSSIRSE